MEILNSYAENEHVRIHYIHNNIESIKAPLLICPGLSESSKDYADILCEIDDRKVIALSFRGRGESISKSNGYTLENHIEDIELVVRDLGLDKFYIMGYSRGVSYTIQYAIENDHKLKGLILGEYPAEHKKMPKGWAKESMDFYNTHCDSISITYEVLEQIEKDSRQVYFKDKLHNITCPTLILKGELEETLLSNEDINIYLNNINSKEINISRFKESGHDIKENDLKNLVEELKRFMEFVDNKN